MTRHGLRGLLPAQTHWLVARVARDQGLYFRLQAKFPDRWQCDDVTKEYLRRARAVYEAMQHLSDHVQRHAGAGHPDRWEPANDADLWLGDGI